MKKFFKHSKKYLLLVLTVVMMVATSMVVLAAEKAPDPKNLTILTVGIQNTNKDGSLKYDANGNKSIKAQSPVLYTNGGSEFEVTLPGTGDNEAMVELPNSITLDVDARIKIDKNEDGKINGNDKGEGSHIDGEYTVKSSNERVATVTMSEDGESITIVAGDTTGTATIKLTEKYPVNAKKPKTATVKVTVKELVDEITFDDSVVDNNTVVVGTKGTVTLGTTTNAAASKKTIKYVVSKEDSAYISVNAKGVITAKKNTSSLEGGYAEVQVLAQDQTYTYEVTAKNGKVSTKKVTWGANETIRVYVNDPEVKSAKVLNLDFAVDKKGNSLESTYTNGKKVQSYATVNLKTNTSSDMHTFKLQVAAYSEAKWGGVQKEDAVTFTTSNAKVATVDANGVITGHANGTAKITVVPVDGVKLTGQEVLTINVSVTTDVEKIEVADTAPIAYAGSTYTVKANVNANVSDKNAKTLAYTLVSATPAVELEEGEKFVNGKKSYDTFTEYITAVSGEKNVTAGKIKSNIEGTVELKVNLKDATLAAAHPELERTVVITFVDPISSVSAKVPTYKNSAAPSYGSSATLYLDRNPNGTENGYTDDFCEIQTIVSKKFAKEIHNLDKEIAVEDLRDIVVATSSNDDVAEVRYDEESKAYVVTATGAGKATITLTATDGSKKSAKVTITVAQKVTDITVAGEIVETDKKVIYLAPNNKNVTTTKFAATTDADATNKGVTYLFTPADAFKKADSKAGTPAGAYASYLTNKNQEISINANGYKAMFENNDNPVLIGTLTVTAKDAVNYTKLADEYKTLANHVAHATSIEVYATKAPEYFTQEKLNKMITDAIGTDGITLLRGEKLDLGSELQIPDEITVRTLTWSSSDKNSVAVDAKGILTAKKVTDTKKSYKVTVKVSTGYETNEKGKLVETFCTYDIPVRVIASQADIDKELNSQIAAVLKEHGTWYGIKPTYTAKNYTFTLAINDIFANDNAGEMTKQLTKILTDFRDAAKVAVSGTATECQVLAIYDAETDTSWEVVGDDFNNNDAITALATQMVSDLGELGKWANKTLLIGVGAENAVDGYEAEEYITIYTANVTAKDADMETYLDAKVDAAVNAFETTVNAEQATNGLGAVTYDTTKNAVAVEIYKNDVVLATTADSVKAAMTASLTELFTKVEGATVEVVKGTNRSEGFTYDQASGVAAFVDALYAELTESATALKELNGTTAYMTVTFDYAGKDYVKTYELTFTRTVEAIDKEADDKLVAYMNGLASSNYGTFAYAKDSNYAVVTVKDFEVTIENEDLLAKVEGFLNTILDEAAIELVVDGATNGFVKGTPLTKDQLLAALKPNASVTTLAELVGTTATVKAEYGAKAVYYTIDFVMDASVPAGVVSAAVAEQVALNNEAAITEDSIVLDEIFYTDANSVAVALNKAKANTTVASLEDVEMYTLFETILANVQPYCAKSVTVTGNGKTATADFAGATSEELVTSIMSTLKISKVSDMTKKPFEITVRYNDNQTLKYVVTFSSENVAGISRSPIMLDKMSFSQSFVAGKNVCKEIYYTGRVGEMIVTVTGKDAYVIYKGEKHEAVDGVVSVQIDKTQSFWDPMPVFAIGNGGAKTATYKVALTYPVGHQMNPEVIKDLSDFASYLDNAIEEGNTAGYYYTYTAVADGTVSLWYGETTEGVEGEISVSNDTTYEYFTLTEDGVEDWTGDKTLTVEVSKGDVLTINVGVLPDADWNYPAMEYSVAAIFEYPLGHKNNPKELSIYEVPGSVSLAVPAGETVYFESYSIGGLEMDVQTTSTGSAVVIHNDKTYKANSKGLIELTLAQSANRQPVSFAIKNTSKNFVYYNVSFAYPVGWRENPAAIESGVPVSGKLAKGDNDGYFYSYTAPAEGVVTLSLSNVTKGVTGDICVFNNNTYEQFSLAYDGVDNELVVPVAADDVLDIQVVAMPDKNWNIPAMSYKLSMTFAAPLGHESNPVVMTDLTEFATYYDGAVEAAKATEYYYYSYTPIADGTVSLWFVEEVAADISVNDDAYLLSVDGEEDWLGDKILTVPVTKNEPISVRVLASEDVEYSLAAIFEYPLGSALNPKEISVYEVPGSVSLAVPAGQTVYFESYSIGGLEMDVQTTATGSAVVIHNGKTYSPNTNKVIELTLAQSENRQPVSFAIKNTSKNFVYYNVSFAYPLGWYENPQVIEAPGTVSGKTAKGDNDGYYYTYTAVEDGTLTFKLSNVTSGVTGDINVTNMSTYEQLSLSYDGKNKMLSVPVLAGDELMFNVIAAPDKNWNVPAMSYKLTMAVVAPTFLEDLGDFEVPCSVDVTVPAGETVFYQSWSLSEVEMSIEATGSAVVIYQREEFSAVEEPLTFTFPKVPMFDRRPLNFGIKNTSDVDVTYTLEFVYPVGHQMNPEVIAEAPATVNGTLAEGNATGYYYTYTTWADGTLTFAFSDVTEGVVGDISVFNNNSYESLSLSYDGVDGELTVPVLAGDELTITVATAGEENDWSYPEMSYTMTMTYAEYPYLDYFEAPANVEVTVPAGETAYYQSYGLSGLEMTVATDSAVVIFQREYYEAVDGEITVIFPETRGRMPMTFGIKNTSEADATYTLAFDYLLGSYNKPEEIEGAPATVEGTLAANNSMGYYYTYTTWEDGTLTFTFDDVTEGVVGDISVFNNNSYESLSLSYDGKNGVLSVPVLAGDVLTIQVVALPGADWSVPEMSYAMTMGFVAPTMLEYFEVPGSVSVTVPAGETVYYQSYMLGGLKMTVKNDTAVVYFKREAYEAEEGAVNVTFPTVMGRQAMSFGIKNTSSKAATYTLEFEYPLGSQMRPEEISDLGEWAAYYDASVAANTNGYYYTYTAIADGTVDLFFAENSVDADIVVYNEGSYEQLSLENDGVADWMGDKTLTVPVSEGDVLQINIIAVMDENYTTPALDFSLAAAFKYPVGSELNPMEITLSDMPAVLSLTVPAGETVYYQSGRIGGYNLTVASASAVVAHNGQTYTASEENDYTVTFKLATPMMWGQSVVFSIQNPSDVDVTYSVTLSEPVGSMNNPEAINAGDNTYEFDASEFEHYFKWVATGDGTMTFDISATVGGWQYVVNLERADGTYAYGDQHWSDDNPVVTSQSYEVSAGDVVVIMIAKYETVDVSPATTANFNISLEEAEEPEGGEGTEGGEGEGTEIGEGEGTEGGEPEVTE